jgi:peptidoglycan/LPS O-acetylase OafA/YrhL
MGGDPTAPIPGGRGEFRPDIQGLRALAVTLVLLFHLFPDFIPGGYVGVDVFFVISGFLMTALLLREAEATGRVSLISFYARRVRRLLPAATVVLLAVAFAAPLLPETRWKDTGWDILASALYVENWRLAWLAVDYLGAESARRVRFNISGLSPSRSSSMSFGRSWCWQA